ncbi:MAG: hypothetical protein ACHQTF_11390, partial [Gemmatimonadales bacterium]
MAAALACAACSTGPLNAPTTATYSGTFTFVFTPNPAPGQPASVSASLVGDVVLGPLGSLHIQGGFTFDTEGLVLDFEFHIGAGFGGGAGL